MFQFVSSVQIFKKYQSLLAICTVLTFSACGGNTGSFSQRLPANNPPAPVILEGPGSGGSIVNPNIGTLACGFTNQTIQLTTTGFHPDAALVFSWQSGYSAPAGVGLTNTGVLTIPASLPANTYTLKVQVTATRNGLVEVKQIDVTVVVEGNCGPGSGGSIVNPNIGTLACGFTNQTIQLTTTGFHPDAALVFSWQSGYSAPSGVGLTNTGVLTLPASLPANTYTLKIQVTATRNGLVEVKQIDVTVVVEGNCGPGSGGSIVNPNIGTLACGFTNQTIQLTTTGFHPDAALVFSWQSGYSAPAGVGLTNTGVLTLPASLPANTYTLKVQVTATRNGLVEVKPLDINVTIPDCDGPGGTITVGAIPSVTCSSTFPQDIALTLNSMGSGTAYSIIELKKDTANYAGTEFSLDSTSAPTKITVNPKPEKGTYTFKVRATRNNQNVHSSEITVTIPDCDGPGGTITVGVVPSVTCSSTFPQDIALTLNSMGSGTAYSIIELKKDTANYAGTEFSLDSTSAPTKITVNPKPEKGTYTLKVRATRNAVNADSDTISFTVPDCSGASSITLTINSSQNTCPSTTFNTLSFTATPEPTGIIYSIVPVSPTSASHAAKFEVNTNKELVLKSGESLSPGTYSLQIKAKNPDGYSPETVFSETITITINDCGPNGTFAIGSYIAFHGCSRTYPYDIPITAAPTGSGTTYSLIEIKQNGINWNPGNSIQLIGSPPSSIRIQSRLLSAYYSMKVQAIRNGVTKTSNLIEFSTASCSCTIGNTTIQQGETTNRVRYESATVPYGTSCNSQTQTGSCYAGSITWSPDNFTHETCTQLPPFCGGSGTQSNPYQVCDAPSLNRVRNFSGSYFIQTRDIDLTTHFDCDPNTNEKPIFIPIQSSQVRYDGQNYTVRNFCFRTTPETSTIRKIGLFSAIGNGSYIRNLKLQGVDTEIRPQDSMVYRIGGLIAEKFFSSQLKNIEVTGSIKARPGTAKVYAGGIAAYAETFVETPAEKSLQNLTANVDIDLLIEGSACNVGNKQYGGLEYTTEAGGMFHTVTTYHYGLLTTVTNAKVGNTQKKSSIRSCSSSGVVVHANLVDLINIESNAIIESIGRSTYGWSGCSDASGGIVGTAYETQIRDSTANVSIHSPNLECTGGVVGYLSSLNRSGMGIFNSKVIVPNTQSIRGGSVVGGIAGSLSAARIQQSSITGQVTASPPANTRPNFVGGIVGNMLWSQMDKVYIEGRLILNNAFNNTFQYFHMGGLVGNAGGYSTGTTMISDSYANLVIEQSGEPQQNSLLGGVIGRFSGGINSRIQNVFFNTNQPVQYNTNRVFAGGIIGENAVQAEVFTPNKVYWNQQASGLNVGHSTYNANYKCNASGSCVGRQTNQMRIQALFENWDFNTIWILNNNLYPTLRQ